MATLSEDALAHLYDRASFHAVDNFFQIARRGFSLLDRTDRTATTGLSTTSTWPSIGR